MTLHSTVVGGSNVGRLLNCPGSFQATLALPQSVDVSSEYAAEGTFAHAVMAHLMERRKADHNVNLGSLAVSLLGMEFYDRKLTMEHLQTLILPALDGLRELCHAYGDNFAVVAVERKVAFPGVPGAFGTVDLILRSRTHVLHVDWKFGQGVGVSAVYRDGDSEIVNPQLMFYLTASRVTLRGIYQQTAGRISKPTLVVAIIQPRSEEPLSHTTVSFKDIRLFREDVENAVVNALAVNPPRQKSEHCRFAPCKTTCPLWTGPLLDLTLLGKTPQTPVAADHEGAAHYGAYLAHAKALADMAAMFKKEIDEQMHAFLEAGGSIPGWRLKAKAKQRQWVDEDTVKKALKKLGFDDQDIWQKKLQTFQSTDATARRLGVKIPEELRVAPPSSETTIATTDDPAPVVNRAATIELFRSSLAQLEARK